MEDQLIEAGDGGAPPDDDAVGTDPGETEEEAAITARLQDLSRQREALREEALELHRRLERIAAEKAVARMTDTERAAIAQIIAPQGIEPAEATG